MAGIYTEITKLVTPSSAVVGEAVGIEVVVKNTWGADFYITVAGQYDSIICYFSPVSAKVRAGKSHSFISSFAMPEKSIRFYVWSYYWTGEHWVDDDASYADIMAEEKKLPWGTIALVGGGLALAIALVKPKA